MEDYVFVKESTGDEVIVIDEEGHFKDHLQLDEAMARYGRDVPLAELDVRVEGYRVGSPEYAAYKIGLDHGRDSGASALDDTTSDADWERSRDCLLGQIESDMYSGNPLSGEWADSYSQANLCQDVDHLCHADMCCELADAYEIGHYHGWHEKVANTVSEHFRDKSREAFEGTCSAVSEYFQTDKKFPSNEEIERAAHNG